MVKLFFIIIWILRPSLISWLIFWVVIVWLSLFFYLPENLLWVTVLCLRNEQLESVYSKLAFVLHVIVVNSYMCILVYFSAISIVECSMYTIVHVLQVIHSYSQFTSWSRYWHSLCIHFQGLLVLEVQLK